MNTYLNTVIYLCKISLDIHQVAGFTYEKKTDVQVNTKKKQGTESSAIEQNC